MFVKNGKRINIYTPWTSEDGTRYPNLLDPSVRFQAGVEEIADPAVPEDYSDETYFRTEQDDAPYVVYTRKSQEAIDKIRQSKIDAQIASLEASVLMPRLVREDLILRFLTAAAGQGITQVQLLDPQDPAYSPGFAKMHAFDEQIKALRAQR